MSSLRTKFHRIVNPIEGIDHEYHPVHVPKVFTSVGADEVQLFLGTHRELLDDLERDCAALRNLLQWVNSRYPNAANVPPPFDVIPNTIKAVRDNEPTLCRALLADVVESVTGGPKLTDNSLLVIMNRVVSEHISRTPTQVSVFAGTVGNYTGGESVLHADTLVVDMPELTDVVSRLLLAVRDTFESIARTSTTKHLVLHRRFPATSAEQILAAHRASGLHPRVSFDELATLTSGLTIESLSLWSTDIRKARAWDREESGGRSAIVLSVRVPPQSLWLVPRDSDHLLLVSPEAFQLDHVEVLAAL